MICYYIKNWSFFSIQMIILMTLCSKKDYALTSGRVGDDTRENVAGRRLRATGGFGTKRVAGLAASVLICAVQYPNFKVASFAPKVFTFWWLPRLSGVTEPAYPPSTRAGVLSA